ncbi:MAG: F0F1 ATP synthase subunit delta [Rhodospirillales bacterium]|nr:F0F1 ATP synthase subunit delta [Rhodospirillales bacterium]
MGGVAGRYASALYELADSANALDQVADDLRALRDLEATNADFARLIASPVVGRDAQVRAMTAIAEKAEFNELTVKFVGLLARNRRLMALDRVVGAFLSALAAHRGEVTAAVTSASTMNPANIAAVTKALSDALGSKVTLEHKIDPSLIGGMIVQVGSKMVDSSIATKLQKLRLSMKGIG